MIESNNSLFEVDIDNYNGPLDVLLDLAKANPTISKHLKEEIIKVIYVPDKLLNIVVK